MLLGGGTMSMGTVVSTFLISFIGGGVAGYVMGRLVCWLVMWLRGWPTAEITLPVASAYLTSFIADHYLVVSGVVGTVIARLVWGSTGRTRLSPTTLDHQRCGGARCGSLTNAQRFGFAAHLS